VNALFQVSELEPVSLAQRQCVAQALGERRAALGKGFHMTGNDLDTQASLLRVDLSEDGATGDQTGLHQACVDLPQQELQPLLAERHLLVALDQAGQIGQPISGRRNDGDPRSLDDRAAFLDFGGQRVQARRRWGNEATLRGCAQPVLPLAAQRFVAQQGPGIEPTDLREGRSAGHGKEADGRRQVEHAGKSPDQWLHGRDWLGCLGMGSRNGVVRRTANGQRLGRFTAPATDCARVYRSTVAIPS